MYFTLHSLYGVYYSILVHSPQPHLTSPSLSLSPTQRQRRPNQRRPQPPQPRQEKPATLDSRVSWVDSHSHSHANPLSYLNSPEKHRHESDADSPTAVSIPAPTNSPVFLSLHLQEGYSSLLWLYLLYISPVYPLYIERTAKMPLGIHNPLPSSLSSMSLSFSLFPAMP